MYKLIAGRTQDLADIEKVITAVTAAGQALDWAYIDGWCQQWGVAERAAGVKRGLTGGG